MKKSAGPNALQGTEQPSVKEDDELVDTPTGESSSKKKQQLGGEPSIS
ncbi:MAG: hypothetical protein IT382_16510, partial [Deltaproteobacteria bacterium]|nr:hypothetical protein [Deltaproteobacteria bacterium]